MARFWLGPWQWATPAEGGGYWSAPALAAASLDLRSTAQCAATITPSGFGLFVTPNAADLGSDYRNLGTDPTALLSAQQKNIWSSMFGLPQSLAANRLYEALWETLTFQADPTGDDRCAPIVPTMARQFELWLAGQRVRNVQFAHDGAEAIPLRDMLKRQYRAIRQRCLDGLAPPEHYRKVLGFWVRKYRIAYRWFQPDDLPDERDLPPATTITESFNTADSTTLGPDLTWTEVVHDWSIASNRARSNNGGGRARAEHDLSSDDHYAQVTWAAGSVNVGPAARFDPAGNTQYFFLSDLRIFKCVAGALTSLGDGGASATVGSILKLSCNGSSLEGFDDGLSVLSLTDTAIAGNVRCGMYADQNKDIDTFEAADLGGGAQIAECPVAVASLSGVLPATVKRAGLSPAAASLSGVLPATVKRAALTPAVATLGGVVPGTIKRAGLAPAAATLAGVTPTTVKRAALPTAAAVLGGVVPGTVKRAGVSPAVVTLLGLVPTTSIDEPEADPLPMLYLTGNRMPELGLMGNRASVSVAGSGIPALSLCGPRAD